MSLSLVQQRQITVESELPSTIHPLIRRVLAARGIVKEEQINHQLDQLPNPFLMKDMQVAIDRLLLALDRHDKIIVVGDFDADGATSTALMLLALEKMGFNDVNFMVPNRFEYGYGLSERIVEELSWQKPQLIITVDNGISSIEGVEKANALGIDVLITDHHLPAAQLPAALAILNPNQDDCPFPAKSSAGVGVVFYLLMALRKSLREKQWFSSQQLAEPNLADYLDLVALGTVADVVPLDHYNRILVMQGLQRIRRGKMRPGIHQLLQLANKDHRFLTSTDIGFALGPRLNAAGRLDDMSQGIMMLLTESDALALELAQSLNEMNQDRRVIEQQMQKEAMAIVDEYTADMTQLPKGFCLYHPEWHQGIVGLVASRLKEKFHRPVIAFAQADDGAELKGSGRSIKGIHLRDVMDEIATAYPQLLKKFGGHAMAAGLSLQQDNLAEFEQAFITVLDNIKDQSVFDAMIETDGDIASKDLNLLTAQLIRDIVPWGQQLPEPQFEGDFELLEQKIVGSHHLKMKLSQDGLVFDAIYFNIDPDIWPNASVRRAHIVYQLSINHFRGNQNLQLMVRQMFVAT